MKRLAGILLLGTVLFIGGSAAAKPSANRTALRVVMNDRADDKIGFTATQTMHTTADAILAVFDDVDVAEKWVYRCVDHASVFILKIKFRPNS